MWAELRHIACVTQQTPNGEPVPGSRDGLLEGLAGHIIHPVMMDDAHDRLCVTLDVGLRAGLHSRPDRTRRVDADQGRGEGLHPWRSKPGSTTPEHGVGELSSIYSGQGKQAEDEKEHLSQIINVVNERFGMQLGTADQLFFDQLEETWVADEALVAQARANDLANFRLPFTDVFLKTIVGRMDDNADIFKRILDEPAFQATVLEHYLQRVFDRARTDAT